MTELDLIKKDFIDGLIDNDTARTRIVHIEKGNILDSYHIVRSHIGDFTIDTCWAGDMQKFETAIWIDHNKIAIVDWCDNKDEVISMHEFWISAIKWKMKNEEAPYSMFDWYSVEYREWKQ